MKKTEKTRDMGKFSIRKVLFCLLACSVILVGAIGLGAFQISFERYDQTIYDLAFESLNLYTANVENELKNIEKHTFSLATNSTLQQYLKQANSPDETGRHSVYLSLISMLSSIGFKENYTDSVTVVDNLGSLYSQGRNRSIPKEELDSIVRKAAEAHGENIIMLLSDDTPSIIFARQIRKMENMDLIPYGTLILRINPQALIRYTAQYAGRYSGNMVIFQGDHLAYEEDGSVGKQFIEEVKQRQAQGAENGFFIRRSPQGRQFVVYSRSGHTGWTYLNALSYDEIFHDLYQIRQLVLVCLILALILVLLVGLRLSDAISRPIIRLSRTMSRVETGNFQVDPAELRANGSFQEIRQLCDDYVIMLSKIDTLINENYKKQLLLKDAQLKWLEAQINPHFLYNTLESINWMARMEGNDKIASMAKSLGQLMRSAISRDSSGTIALSRELELLEDYLQIQKIRHENRLEVTFDIDREVMNASIPKLILQPLVENSVNYALEKMTGCWHIVITAKAQEEMLLMTVSDNGPGIDPKQIDGILDGTAQTSGTGLGLRNIRERLRILYGEQGHFELIGNPGTTVRISLPFEEDDHV